jgi:hypothetical protein
MNFAEVLCIWLGKGNLYALLSLTFALTENITGNICFTNIPLCMIGIYIFNYFAKNADLISIVKSIMITAVICYGLNSFLYLCVYRRANKKLHTSVIIASMLVSHLFQIIVAALFSNNPIHTIFGIKNNITSIRISHYLPMSMYNNLITLGIILAMLLISYYTINILKLSILMREKTNRKSKIKYIMPRTFTKYDNTSSYIIYVLCSGIIAAASIFYSFTFPYASTDIGNIFDVNMLALMIININIKSNDNFDLFYFYRSLAIGYAIALVDAFSIYNDSFLSNLLVFIIIIVYLLLKYNIKIKRQCFGCRKMYL